MGIQPGYQGGTGGVPRDCITPLEFLIKIIPKVLSFRIPIVLLLVLPLELPLVILKEPPLKK